jgi:hypothetical protein
MYEVDLAAVGVKWGSRFSDCPTELEMASNPAIKRAELLDNRGSGIFSPIKGEANLA